MDAKMYSKMPTEFIFRLWMANYMTFESLQPTPFCLKKSSMRKWTFKGLTALQSGSGRNKVKYARITITHVYFIALTLAYCRVPQEIFEHSFYRRRVLTASSGPTNVNARTTTCDP